MSAVRGCLSPAGTSYSRRPLAEARPAHGSRRNVMARSTGWADPQHNISEKALFGEDFGARDPTAGELASNFGDTVLGNYDTAHIIKVPARLKLYLGLGSRALKPADELTLLEAKEQDLLKNQVPGWRVAAGTPPRLAQEWKGKDAAAAVEIARRLSEVSADEHAPLRLQAQGDTVYAELSTPAIGGLSENDFIVASRMNDVEVKDLLAKKKMRYWA